MKASENRVEWMKMGQITQVTFIMKHVLLYAEGCCIGFFNTITKEKTYMSLTHHNKKGDGVKCIAGHKRQGIFAYSEACSYPYIHVYTYPGLAKVSTINDEQMHGHVKLEFTYSSMLICLGNAPNFTLSIYNIYTGAKNFQENSQIRVQTQIIRCSLQRPEYMVQLATGTTKIQLWDLFNVCNNFLVTPHAVTFQGNESHPLSSAVWSPDNNLYVLDIYANVYQVNHNYKMVKIIDGGGRSPVKYPCIHWLGGILMGVNNRIIRYSQVKGKWKESWEHQFVRPFITMRTNYANIMVYVDGTGVLYKFNENGQESKLHFDEPCLFTHIGLIYPMGQYCVAMGNIDKLYVFKIDKGDVVTTYTVKDGFSSFAENPEFPYVAVGYQDGYLELISLYHPDNPTHMTGFQLSRNKITHIYFCTYGKVFVTGNLDIGEFFILEGFPGGTIKVITSVQARQQIVDFMLVPSKNCYRLFVVPVTTKTQLSGHKFVRFCVLGKDKVSRKEYMTKNKTMYHQISATNKPNRDRVFLAVPKGSKVIHQIETRRGSSEATVIAIIQTGHLLSHFNFQLTKAHAVTCGCDGLAIVRDNNFKKQVGISMVHHRRYLGVVAALVDPLEQYIITLGRENVLACTKLMQSELSASKKANLEDLMKSSVFERIFNKKTKGFMPKGELAGKSWLEYQDIMQTQEDILVCRFDREMLLKDLNETKATIQNLITLNLEGPENQMLELTEFNLNLNAYKELCKKTDDECEYLNKYYRKLIVEQDKVFNYIKTNFYDIMMVPERQLYALFQNHCVANYSLPLPNIEQLERIENIEEYEKLESLCAPTDRFYPWNRYTKSQLDLLKLEKPKIDEGKIDLFDTTKETPVSFDTILFIDGTMTKMYIEKFTTTQENTNLFVQIHQQNETMMQTIFRLKEIFNKEFNSLMEIKEREMYNLRERNARQKKIISENNYFSETKIHVDINDPEWVIEENPPLILEVLPNEMSITPYISPSEQAILDAKAAEDERIRLMLLADDFKERALMAMMNGVLEIRWEDELKKNVPLPKCMIEKDPMNFDEDDLRAVKDYEEKVAFLRSERERYKGMLDKEFTKNCNNIKDAIRKFNIKVTDLNTLKMKIESAIIQEQTLQNTRRIWQLETVNLYKRQNDILNEISATEEKIAKISVLLRAAEETVKEYKVKTDAYLIKDKIIEKNFKRDISEFSPMIQEIAIKIYKKRPKASYRQITSSTILNDLSKGVITGERYITLNTEAIEFLNSLDQLDNASGLPPNMDEHTYAIIVKNRRSKIEMEIKMRSINLEITYAENLIQIISKRLTNKKDNLTELNNELLSVRQQTQRHSYNIVVQMVLRSGFMEMPLTGHVDDFDNALLIPREEILNINALIREAGDIKLKTMTKNMAFHRKVMSFEWRHVKMRMILNDLCEQLCDVLDVKLTRDVMKYLKQKKKGNVKLNTIEMEMDLQRRSFMMQLRDLHKEVAAMKTQIQSVVAQNESLDNEINATNIAINTIKTQINPQITKEYKAIEKTRTKRILSRSQLMQKMQDNHNEILMLQTELELLRLKTYPTFQYKELNIK